MTNAPASVRMPDLMKPVRLGRHVLDTALSELRMRGVPDEMIRIHTVASGAGNGAMVSQVPLPGQVIDPRGGVHLFVERLGVMDRLPYALRDEEPDAFGTDQVLSLFDSPAAHAGHYLRLGGDLFALRDGDDRGAQRWLEDVFSIESSQFGKERWYRLARFAARLHAVAGRPDAVLTALRALYGFSSRIVRLDAVVLKSARTPALALGRANNQVGFSTVLGGAPMTLRRLVIHIGPVSLPEFEQHRTQAMREERIALYRLCLPFWIDADVFEHWQVTAPEGGMRLGIAGTSPRLGWTSYVSRQMHAPSLENSL